ncbi:lipopolysaccharide biosynthesis protein [Microbacterium sp. NPDC055683]
MSDTTPSAPRGARTLMLAQIAKAATLFLGVFVLSRILTPTEFGLVAVPIALVGIGEILRDLGLSAAATTHPDLSREARDLLFWVNVGVAIVLSGAVLLLAPILADAFDNNTIATALPWLSIVFLLNGISAQYRADLNRRMRFGSMALADSSGALGGVAIAIFVALAGGSFWALIVQQISNSLIVGLVVIVACRWLPGLPRRANGAKKLLTFGLSVSWSQALIYAGNNVDTLALGYWSPAQQLGYYTRSFQLAVQPFVMLKQPATAVALPLLSRRAADPSTFSSAAVRGQKLVAYTIVPAALLLAGAAEPLVALILGDQWLPAVPIVIALAAASATQQLVSVANWMMIAGHQGKALRRYSLVSLVVKVACIVTVAPFGPVAVALGYLAAAVISSPIALVWACRATGVRVRAVIPGVLQPAAIGSAAAALAWVAGSAAHQFGPWIASACSVLVFALVYATVSGASKTIRNDIRMVLDSLLRRSR